MRAEVAPAVRGTELAPAVLEELTGVVGARHVLTGDRISPDVFADESLRGATQPPAALVLPADAGEVAAVVRVAAEHGIPVTARGAGTGLSGACVPSAGGMVVSFERMSRVLDLDLSGHTAVVQPGIALVALNAHLAPHGLVYPVFPGTDASSVGGTVATNAGGMRAIRYGVTRSHVLGVEVVTGTGELLRFGGPVVKSSSGYDLTQLIVGSEGTLALVTEATVSLSPVPPHSATVLAPFVDVDAVAAVVPRVVASGVQPSVLEYIDRGTMKGLLRTNDLELGVAPAVSARTGAYLVVVLEGRSAEEVEASVELVATLVSDAGALDVYIPDGNQGTRLLEARESAFWMVKAAGADDLIDMAVPRGRIPEYLRTVSALAEEHDSRVFGCGHAGDGNVHFSVYQPDDAKRSALLTAIYRAGLALGGVISGEHGIGTAKKSYFQQLTDPGLLELQRRIKGVFDPAGILNPGKILDPA
jgi:glycolate oxidase